MTGRRLAEIRRRLDAATPGPWELWHEKTEAADPAVPYRQCTVAAGGDPVVPPLFDRGYCHANSAYRDESITQADAEFIAHARRDVEDLLDEVMRLRRELVTRPPPTRGHSDDDRRTG